MRFTLPKSEILRGFKSFARVITEGTTLSAPPVRCYYRRTSSNYGSIAAGFSVSRNIRKATDRNRAKRLMRESYRFNKRILMTERGTANQSVEIVFMFAGTTSALHGKNSFQNVKASMHRIITLIADREK